MRREYHEYRTQSNYLSSDPDDAGVRYRVSGNLFLCYKTARANPDIVRSGKKRSSIIEFTHGTGVRMARYLRECTAKYRYMHTLTYPSEYPSDGATVKYHLRRYCQELRRISSRLGHADSSIFWFLEFQKRGAPHFHLLTTDFYSFRRCQQLWFAIVNSGDLKHLKAGVRVEKLKCGKKGMIAYAKKYAIKQVQKEVPVFYENVGRFYGVYGLKKVVAAGVTFYTDSCRKSDILAYKTLVDSTITKLIANGSIVSIKKTFGFRMFHINDDDGQRELMQIIAEADCFVDKRDADDALIDAELAEHHVRPLTELELEQAKKNYLRAKWGEIDMRGLVG